MELPFAVMTVALLESSLHSAAPFALGLAAFFVLVALTGPNVDGRTPWATLAISKAVGAKNDTIVQRNTDHLHEPKNNQEFICNLHRMWLLMLMCFNQWP